MRFSLSPTGLLRVLLPGLLVAGLLAACRAETVWVPPSSPAHLRPAMAMLAETQTVLGAETPGPAVATPAVPAVETAVAAVETAAAPTLAPVEASPTPTASPSPTATQAPPAEDPGPVSSPAPVVITATSAAPPVNQTSILYYAQAADTLPVVAVRFGVQPSEITSGTGDPLPGSAFLKPGQLLIIPRRPLNTTSARRLLPDSEFVYSPSAVNFDAEEFVRSAGGKLSTFREWHKSTGFQSGAETVMRVANENSINPRLLFALLEYHSQWVYGQPPSSELATYPLGQVDLGLPGLYNQLVWTVNQLSSGYYAWREGRLTEIHFPDGVTARLSPELNAGSAALQYYFAQLYQGQEWLDAIDPDSGFPALHARMFGNPWERALAVEPLFPTGITQPALILPFTRNWQWSYTGGPHGAWEQEGAYAALDFAPGSLESGCVESSAWTTAAASGLVVRTGTGLIVIDLDGDGYEQTGWVLVYLHVAEKGRIPVGAWVDTGDRLGRPSCEGGISTGTHIHIARKYNGEWVPADGPLPFDLGGWVAHAGPAAYKGTLTRDGVTLNACTCSSPDTFIQRGPDDP